MQNRNRHNAILVPLDGSDQSFETIRYVGEIVAPKETSVTLFHVVSPIPKSFLDFQRNPPAGNTTALNQGRMDKIEEFIDKASATLHQQGVHPKNVKRVIQARQRGVARDILSEALRDYDALAIGRWRHKAMKNQIMGGTANKIVNNLYNIPVWLVGARSGSGRVLVAMDRSNGALRAFTHAKMVLGKSSEILLYSVIRTPADPLGESDKQVSMPEETERPKPAVDQLKKTEAAIQSRFSECKKQLKQAGGDAIRIESKIGVGLPSRAGGIITEARRGGYNTIIMGRRGLSDVRQYAMGQVSQKILTMATDKAVWVVN